MPDLTPLVRMLISDIRDALLFAERGKDHVTNLSGWIVTASADDPGEVHVITKGVATKQVLRLVLADLEVDGIEHTRTGEREARIICPR
jgi:hypothetical protein